MADITERRFYYVFHKGQRVTMTRAARRSVGTRRSYTDVVSSEPRTRRQITVLRDGLKTTTTYWAGFWRPELYTSEELALKAGVPRDHLVLLSGLREAVKRVARKARMRSKHEAVCRKKRNKAARASRKDGNYD